MTDHDLVIRGGRLIGAAGESVADVAVDGERIATIGTGCAPGARSTRAAST